MSGEKLEEDYSKLFSTLDEYFRDKLAKKEQPDPDVLKISSEVTKLINERYRKATRETWITRIGAIFLLIGLLALFWPDLEIHILFGIRYIIVLLAPIFDLTKYFANDPCILTNPSYVPESRITSDMCQMTCHANNKHKFLRKFAANSDFNQTLFQLYVYENDIPIIETTEISEWRIKKTSDIIDAYYTELKTLDADQFCIFDSPDKLVFKSPIDLIKKFYPKTTNSYYAMWENCGRTSSKLIKKLIRRPIFLPNTIEVSTNTWLFMSQGYSQREHLPIPVMSRVILFCQIRGASEIILTPVDTCLDECSSHVIHLEEGQIALITDLWIVDYKAAAFKENIVLILMTR